MAYNLDLNCLTVQTYKDLLKGANLLPGRRILWQDIDENFTAIESSGNNTVWQLKKALSSPAKLAAFAATTGISTDYLTILKREIGSLEQKPVALIDFPDVDAALISRLNRTRIKTSKDYFESNPPEKDELYALCDLVRINGVGAVAARTFFEAGFKSVADVATADAGKMVENVSAVNREKQYYKVNLGLKDMQFCIDFARLLMRFCAR